MKQKGNSIMKKTATIYIDDRSRKYRVMLKPKSNTYKAQYQKPGGGKWVFCSNFPRRDTEAAAEADLKEAAKKKQWQCCYIVSAKALNHIIQDKERFGLFAAWNNGVWIGADKRIEGAQIEEFPSLDEVLDWLADPGLNI